MTGSPCVTANPSLGIAALRENALALIRWQPVQWQAIVTSGGALILRRTCPQRHPPSQGKSGRFANRFTPCRHAYRISGQVSNDPAGRALNARNCRSVETLV